MNSMQGYFLHFIVFTVVLLLSAVTALAEITIHDTQTTDVTSSSFAVIWRTSEAATPQITIFSDEQGTNDVTAELEVTPVPLFGGNPGILDEYVREEGMEDLRALAQDLGLMKVGVQGCLPQTTYYFRVLSDNGFDNAQWPESGFASVTTTKENAFVYDSKQVMVTLVDNLGTLDSQGWLMTASTSETIYPISSYVGDGGDTNQAYLDLSNLFDGDEDNWIPTGLQVITLEVRMPGANPIQRGLTLFYSETFHVSTVSPVEINIDEAGDDIPPNVWASPPGDTYYSPQSVTLSANEEAGIFFTRDGNNPTTSSNTYTDPIQIDETTTLKFMAVDMAGNQSEVVSALYTIVFNQPPYEPSSPYPGDGATEISIDTSLGWQGGDPDPVDVVIYDVFLGPTDNDLSLLCEDQAAPSCPAGTFQFNTIYYWQVMAKDNQGGETTGPVWRFTTFTYNGDEDADGLTNEDEISWGTDPFDWDTDKDGYSDGEEFGVGTDPLSRTSIPPYPPRFGDFDGDHDIDGADLSLFVSVFGSTEGDDGYNAMADFDKDGLVNEADLQMFSRVFGYAFNLGYDPSSDFDDDGDVDGVDLTMLMAAFGTSVGEPGYDMSVDINDDGIVNRWDLALFSITFGRLAE